MVGALLISLCFARLMVGRHLITTRVVNLHLSLNKCWFGRELQQTPNRFQGVVRTTSRFFTFYSEEWVVVSLCLRHTAPTTQKRVCHTLGDILAVSTRQSRFALPVLHLVVKENPDGFIVPTHSSESGNLWLIARVWVSKYYLLPTYRLTA